MQVVCIIQSASLVYQGVVLVAINESRGRSPAVDVRDKMCYRVSSVHAQTRFVLHYSDYTDYYGARKRITRYIPTYVQFECISSAYIYQCTIAAYEMQPHLDDDGLCRAKPAPSSRWCLVVAATAMKTFCSLWSCMCRPFVSPAKKIIITFIMTIIPFAMTEWYWCRYYYPLAIIAMPIHPHPFFLSHRSNWTAYLVGVYLGWMDGCERF